jgi:WD40 repeat protein
MSRVFLSHSSRDSRQAMAVKAWLIQQQPGLVDEIYLDLDPHTGIRPGARWKQALQQANARCEAVICLLSEHWLNSRECEVEFRYAETLNKAILVARLEPLPDTNITSEWQRCDLFVGDGPSTEVEIGDGGEPVVLDIVGLQRLLNGLRALGIGADYFPWPPPDDPERAPYRGWAPLEESDAAVFFGRDAQIVRGLDEFRGMCTSGVKSLLVILGPSGAGKSSFLRAGLLPRLRRDDRTFLPMDIVRPERAVLTGELGLAHAVHQLRTGLGLREPVLGVIKNACYLDRVEQLRGWLEEARQVARTRLLDLPAEQPAPTLVLPVDQAEELFNTDAGPEAVRFLELLAALVQHEAGATPALIVAVTIRADRYEPLQIAPELAGVHSMVFDDLKPMPPAGYKDVITGPARRATTAGWRLSIEPALVERLLTDAADGADALPLLALTLERLYRDFGDCGELSVADYAAMGGMAHVVQTEVDNLLAPDPDQRRTQLDTLHHAFIPWLATINPASDQPMRRLARWGDLPAASRPLIQAMVDKRLLVKDTRDGQTVVEVALESLLRQWAELASWLREERQHLVAADDVERNAAAWAGHGDDPAWLLTGTRLTDAETLAQTAEFGDRLAAARDYLMACRAVENERLAAAQRHRDDELRLADERRQAAEVRAREATALRLNSEAAAILAGTNSAGDVRAFHQLLAARALADRPDEGALLQAVATRASARKIIDAGTAVASVAFSPDGRQVAGGSAQGTVLVWDADTGEPIGEPLAGHADAVLSVAFSPDGHRLASAGGDGAVRLWNPDTGQPHGDPLIGHAGHVTSVAFSPDGHRLASAGGDGTVRLWNPDTGQPHGDPMTGGHTFGVHCVAFSPDGRRLASCGYDNVRLWDAVTGQAFGAALTGHTDQVTAVAFSPDGHMLASASLGDGTVRLWDTGASQLGTPLRGHTFTINDVAFSPDGHRLATAGGDHTVRLWDADTGQSLGDPLTGHAGQVLSVVFSPGGHLLATAGDDGAVWLWDVDTGASVGDLFAQQPGAPRSVVAFSPDGHTLTTASEDGSVRLWDADTGQPNGNPLAGHTEAVLSVAFSPDGHRLATASVDGSVRLWDADTGQPNGNPLAGHTEAVLSVAFSPDGHRLATASVDGSVRLWDADTGQPNGEPLTGHADAVLSVAFSPDGHRLATAGEDCTVRLWDAVSGEPVADPLTGHVRTVLGVVFSPDGRRLASRSADHTVRLWDADTGVSLGALTGHTDWVSGAVFSPDGQRLVTASFDGTLRIWPTVATPEMLCDKLTANMSRKQWREWISADIDYIRLCPGLPIPPD